MIIHVILTAPTTLVGGAVTFQPVLGATPGAIGDTSTLAEVNTGTYTPMLLSVPVVVGAQYFSLADVVTSGGSLASPSVLAYKVFVRADVVKVIAIK